MAPITMPANRSTASSEVRFVPITKITVTASAVATSGDSSGLATCKSRATTKHEATNNRIVTAPLPTTETIPNATAAPTRAPMTWMNAPLVA